MPCPNLQILVKPVGVPIKHDSYFQFIGLVQRLASFWQFNTCTKFFGMNQSKFWPLIPGNEGVGEA